jgi:hypothetical protein
MAERSKGRSHAGFAGSNPAVSYGYPCLVSVACCQVEVSALDRSLVQRNPTDFGVSN